jgi:uncharacterized protein
MMGVPVLQSALVFKGGTCLRKAYFVEYRFSEDLDFSLRSAIGADVLWSAMQAGCALAEERLSAYGPFEVLVERAVHRTPHPDNQIEARIRVRYPWMAGSAVCTLKVEINPEEPVLLTPSDRQLLHAFPDESLEASLPCYRLEEVIAEKLRALLQKRRQLELKGWSANRPRDLYDLQYLYLQAQHPIDWAAVTAILPQKASVRDVSYHGKEDFLDTGVLAGIEASWHTQLSGFIRNLPPFPPAFETLHALLDRVFPGDMP